MRNYILLAALFLTQSVFADGLNTLYSEQTLHIADDTSVIQMEPGFRAQYIQIEALSGQFQVTELKVTNQYADVLNLDSLTHLSGNLKTFGSGAIDKTGVKNIPSKVVLFIGNDISVERLSVTLQKRAGGEGGVQVSLLVDPSATDNQPITPAPITPVQPTPRPGSNPPPVQPPTPTTPVVPPAPPVVPPAPTACQPTAVATPNLDRIEEVMKAAVQVQMQYTNANSGSAEESAAAQQLSSLQGTLKALLSDPNLGTYNFRSLEAEMLRSQKRYEGSYSGTTLEAMTLLAIDRLGEALVGSVQRELACGTLNSAQTISLAKEYEQKLETAPDDSDVETAYENLQSMLWKKAVEIFTKESLSISNYRDAEDRGMQFYIQYKNSAAGSDQETANANLTMAAFNRAENLFRDQVALMGASERSQQVKYYRRMSMQYPSGSLVESYAETMLSYVSDK